MSYEQSDHDISEIGRAYELPPDELFPRAVDCPACGSDDVSEVRGGVFRCDACEHEWDEWGS